MIECDACEIKDPIECAICQDKEVSENMQRLIDEIKRLRTENELMQQKLRVIKKVADV